MSDVRLHDLRHSFASFLVNRGVSLYVVQGLLGHLHARTTQRYAHLTQDTLSGAVDLMEQVVSLPDGGFDGDRERVMPPMPEPFAQTSR